MSHMHSDADPSAHTAEPTVDAIIFIGGLFENAAAIKDATALRLVRAFEHNNSDTEVKFGLLEAKDEDYASKHKSRVVTIVRQCGEAKTPIADVYQFDYSAALSGDYRHKRAVFQAFAIAGVLVSNFGRIIGSLRRRSKTAVEKLHVFYACLIFVALAAYVPVLIAGVVATGLDAVRTQQQVFATNDGMNTTATKAASAPASSGVLTAEKALRWFQLSVVFLAAAGLFTKVSVKDTLSETSARFVPAVQYLEQDARRGLMMGQFNNLLNHLGEKPNKYRRVHVIAFSFGSVVALDALFPFNRASPRLDVVTTLTTIGAPFDFVRTYWPQYFVERHYREGVPSRWLNIYNPRDILGSNFEDSGPGPVVRGIELKNGTMMSPQPNVTYGRNQQPISLLEPIKYMRLAGFTAHGTYWDRTDTFDVNALDEFVAHIYDGDPALQ